MSGVIGGMTRGYPTQTRERFCMFRSKPCFDPLMGIVFAFFSFAWFAAAGGCSAQGTDGPTRGLEKAERYVTDRTRSRSEKALPARAEGVVGGVGDDARVIGQVDGVPIRWGEFRERLIELSGASVLEGFVLERRLERECAARSITIATEEIARERTLVSEAFVGAGVAAGTEEAASLLAQIRRERGLGDARFDALIRRNAMLRVLITETAAPNEDEIRRAYDARFGERRSLRLVTVTSATEASSVIALARAGHDFSELAVRMSTDVSASRGGLLEPMSVHDERYPMGVRRAAAELAEGAVSDGIALEDGFAVLKLEQIGRASCRERV